MTSAEKINANAPLPAGLPPALRPWSPLFQDMPESHLRLIGGLMGQLNPLLEESFHTDNQAFGDFDGYDGMELRGEIERLMPSEWLWRELAPSEFLRRFAEQELLYHKPSFETPTDERTHLVVLDCGPAMLGRPRLIALAALLSLSAIARGQGAVLKWIAPQGGVQTWQTLLTRKDLQSFLLAANPVSLTAAKLQELLDSVQERKGANGDRVLWTIGAAAIPVEEDVRTNQLAVTEAMVAGPDGAPQAEARIQLTSYLGRAREATLILPPEDECVALLREPFRLRKERADRQRLLPGDADPSWAPQGVCSYPSEGRILARIPDGLMMLTVFNDGGVGNPQIIPLKRFDNLVGVRLTADSVILVTTRDYNGFGQLTMRRLWQGAGKPQQLQEMVRFRLGEKDPIARHKHLRGAIPPLIKPGRKFRFLTISGMGEHYVIDRESADPHMQLPRLSLIGMLGEWAFTRQRGTHERLLVARNLTSSKCVSFALPPNAEVSCMDDLIVWPETMKGGAACFLLARCTDGHWRGMRGVDNLPGEDPFGDGFADVDLTRLGRIVPLGVTSERLGPPPHPAYRMTVMRLDNGKKYYCGFTLAGRVDIEELTEQVGALESRTADGNITLFKSWPVSWQTDNEGFVASIRRHSPVERTPGRQNPEEYQVASLVEEAIWHLE